MGKLGTHNGGKRANTPAQTLLLFGVTGDLSRRMLLPSLYRLYGDGLLPTHFKIIGLARREMDISAFHTIVANALECFVPKEQFNRDLVRDFLDILSYVSLDLSNVASFSALSLESDTNSDTAIFLSTAPSLYQPIIAGLKSVNLLNESARVALEKPLGHDFSSSQIINDAVQRSFAEDRIFRIDHYLGKEAVQNLLALRFGNMLFEPLWNTDAIDHVQITISETIGVEGRSSFYNNTGALRDMVQNHMLQLLAMVAMEPPSQFMAEAIRDEKVKIFRSLHPIDRSNATTHSVRGQYQQGIINAASVSSYNDDIGKLSDTETFVALKVHIDNWRWKGIPFYLRTGKRMPERRSEILVQFKPVPHSIFGNNYSKLGANRLVIRLQPEESIRLFVTVKEPGLDRNCIRLRELPLDLSLNTAFSSQPRRISYERLLLDFIEGDPTLFVRRDEIEAQWEWIDAIRDGWAFHDMRPEAYTAGTWGPSTAASLAKSGQVNWHD